jgi:hypothetical protein
MLGLSLQVAVIEVPFSQAAFGTASMDLAHWGRCAALAFVVLWYDEIRKVFLRRLANRAADQREPVTVST